MHALTAVGWAGAGFSSTTSGSSDFSQQIRMVAIKAESAASIKAAQDPFTAKLVFGLIVFKSSIHSPPDQVMMMVQEQYIIAVSNPAVIF